MQAHWTALILVHFILTFLIDNTHGGANKLAYHARDASHITP